MLTVGVIGVGNAGNQVAALASEKLGVAAVAINSSEKDLNTIPDGKVMKITIGDSRGTGKERGEAKKFLKERIVPIMKSEDMQTFLVKDILIVVSSTGGGTGSGSAPVLAEIVRQMRPTSQVILVGILPTLSEALSTQINTLEYLRELYESGTGVTYMLYDNDKHTKLPSHQIMNKINQSVVDDIQVIQGTFQVATRYSSIDEKDSVKIYGTEGRMVITSIRDLKEKSLDEKSIDDLIIEGFKGNAHAEIQRDGNVHRVGVITNLSEKINGLYDNHLNRFYEFIGQPVEAFDHIVVNEDSHMPNNVFVIAAGLSKVNDRIRKISDRIDEINERQKQIEQSDDELGGIDLKELNAKKKNKQAMVNEELDIDGIFNQYK